MKQGKAQLAVKILGVNVAIFVALFLLAEGILRIRGHRPYSLEESRPTIIVTPGGKFFQKDPVLGYRHLAGAFDLELQGGYSFHVTHDSSSLRMTKPLAYADSFQVPEVWLFGCSFTYGWSINDEETFPWLLQARHPEFDLVNFAVNGYGTVHTYLGLKQALAVREKPALVIVNYADFHMERNTFSFQRRKSAVRWNFLGSLNQPYVVRNEDGSLEIIYKEPEYSPWKLSLVSAFANKLQDMVETVVDQRDPRIEATTMLLTRTVELCREHGIPLLLTNLDVTSEFPRSFCEQNGVPFVDLAVDWEQEGFNNRPHDSHPSAKANVVYASKLDSFLVKEGFLQPLGTSATTIISD